MFVERQPSCQWPPRPKSQLLSSVWPPFPLCSLHSPSVHPGQGASCLPLTLLESTYPSGWMNGSACKLSPKFEHFSTLCLLPPCTIVRICSWCLTNTTSREWSLQNRRPSTLSPPFISSRRLDRSYTISSLWTDEGHTRSALLPQLIPHQPLSFLHMHLDLPGFFQLLPIYLIRKCSSISFLGLICKPIAKLY